MVGNLELNQLDSMTKLNSIRRRHKSISLLFALIFCGGFFAQPVPPAWAEPGNVPLAAPPDAGFLRVGAWNIQNLGTRVLAPQKPADLVAYIAAASVDVLCLEEIHDDDQKTDSDDAVAPYKNATLNEMLPLLKAKTSDDWHYEMTDPTPDNERCQTTGVLWRTARTEMKGRWSLPVIAGKHPHSKEIYWKRRPEAFHFKALNGKADFILIPLHMKSNLGTEGTDMRPIEARQLSDCLASLIDHFKGEKDILLLGDTNINPGEHGVQDVWASFTDLNLTERVTWNNPSEGYPPAPFDRIFVPKGHPEFAKSTETIHGPYLKGGQTEEEWFLEHNKYRSDHLLIWCDIAVDSDDD